MATAALGQKGALIACCNAASPGVEGYSEEREALGKHSLVVRSKQGLP